MLLAGCSSLILSIRARAVIIDRGISLIDKPLDFFFPAPIFLPESPVDLVDVRTTPLAPLS